MTRPPHRSRRRKRGSLRRTVRLSTRMLLAFGLLVAPALGRTGEPPSPDLSDAVVINLTRTDLERMLEETLRTEGGPAFEGIKDRVSKGISDLRYRALVSAPALELEPDGRIRLKLGITEAAVDVGRMERRIVGRMTRCEDAGVRIDPERPLDITLTLRLAIEDDALRIIPEKLSIEDLERNARLIKPARCAHNILPEWLMWWIGKPRLRNRLATMDEVLLAKIRESAGRLNDGGGFLREHWQLEPLDGSAGGTELVLCPRSLRTDNGSLLIGFASSTSPQSVSVPGALDWTIPLASESFLGVSESFLRWLIDSLLGDLSGRPQIARSDLRKLFRSSSVYTLVPGLRDADPAADILFSFHQRIPPRLELVDVGAAGTSGHDSRAMLRVAVSGLEIRIWRAGADRDDPLAVLTVDSGRIGVLPYLNVLGGVSFTLAENEWRLSSSGIDVNEPLLAALLQELVFGGIFQTQFDPVHREAVQLGNAQFHPRYFRVADDYLVIEFGDLPRTVADRQDGRKSPPSPAPGTRAAR